MVREAGGPATARGDADTMRGIEDKICDGLMSRDQAVASRMLNVLSHPSLLRSWDLSSGNIGACLYASTEPEGNVEWSRLREFIWKNAFYSLPRKAKVKLVRTCIHKGSIGTADDHSWSRGLCIGVALNEGLSDLWPAIEPLLQSRESVGRTARSRESARWELDGSIP